MDTVKINMSWSAFSEIREKHPERVLNHIDAGNFHFTEIPEVETREVVNRTTNLRSETPPGDFLLSRSKETHSTHPLHRINCYAYVVFW